jgi:hypothetical protein
MLSHLLNIYVVDGVAAVAAEAASEDSMAVVAAVVVADVAGDHGAVAHLTELAATGSGESEISN